MGLAWRLTPPAYADRLDGRGNMQQGARWNSPGRGVVYASFNLSLAVLETLVQMPAALRRSLPQMAAVRIEIPDEVAHAELDRTELPTDLAAEATVRRCRELGDAWLAAGDYLTFTVPSVIVPQERNVLINPSHPQMAQVKISSMQPFRFDPRLATARG